MITKDELSYNCHLFFISYFGKTRLGGAWYKARYPVGTSWYLGATACLFDTKAFDYRAKKGLL